MGRTKLKEKRRDLHIVLGESRMRALESRCEFEGLTKSEAGRILIEAFIGDYINIQQAKALPSPILKKVKVKV